MSQTVSVPQKSIPWPNHPAAEQIRRSRMLYSWIATSLACLVMAAVALSFTTREFRTVAKIELHCLTADTANWSNSATNTPSATSATAPLPWEEWITQAIREASSDSDLATTVVQAARQVNPQLELKTEDIDFDHLRKQLKFAVVPREGTANSYLLVEFLGGGSITERALVEAFALRVCTHLDQSPQRLQDALDRQTANQRAVQDKLSQRIREMAGASNDLAATIAQIGADLETLQLGLIVGEDLNRFRQSEAGWLGDQIALEFGAESSEMAAFSSRFPELLESSGSEHATSNFQLASSARPAESPRPLGELRKTLMDLPFENFTQQLRELEQLVATPLLAADSPQPSTAPVRVVSVGRPFHEPVGLIAHRGLLMLCLLTALVGGWVVAGRLSPAGFDAGFEREQSLEHTLNLPVVAELSPRRPVGPADLGWRQKIVKASEFVLLATCLLYLGLFVANTEMRDAILNNPLHALARVIWSIAN